MQSLPSAQLRTHSGLALGGPFISLSVKWGCSQNSPSMGLLCGLDERVHPQPCPRDASQVPATCGRGNGRRCAGQPASPRDR